MTPTDDPQAADSSTLQQQLQTETGQADSRATAGQDEDARQVVTAGRDAFVSGRDTLITYLESRPFYRLQRLPGQPATLSVEDARAQPSRMLNARYEIVPFAGRGVLMGRLTEWLQEPARVSVRLVHGPGGQGKSRLAVYFGRARASRWEAWQARDDLVPSQAQSPPAVPDAAAGLLVIVDYADRWALRRLEALIADLQAQAARLPTACPLRFLLLARSAGPWWNAMENDLEAAYGIGAQAIALEALGQDVDRSELFITACQRFAARMGVSEEVPLPVPAELAGPGFGHVLTVHMAALADVDARYGGAEPPREPGLITAYLLRRERAFWHKLRETGRTVTSDRDMGRAVYAATLAGPLPHDVGIGVLARVMGASPVEARHILDDHQLCYPPAASGTVLEPLYPDRLGEDFIALTTTGSGPERDPGYQDPSAAAAIAALLAPDPDEDQREQLPLYAGRTVTVLVETAQLWPQFARGQLFPLLRRSPSLAVAAGAGTLSRLIDMSGVDPDVLAGIDACLTDPDGDQDIELQQVTADLAERVFQLRLEQASDSRARAAAHADLGIKLRYTGQAEKALAETGAAINIYQELGAPEELAIALTDQAVTLGFYLRPTDPEKARAYAEQAIATWERQPGSEDARPKDVAESFNTLGAALGVLGQHEKARIAEEHALRLRERYQRHLPDQRRKRDPLVAASLLNISITLSSLGQQVEAGSFAERSVQAYKAAIEAGHQGLGRIGLMRSLRNLAAIQWDLDERTDSVKNSRESVERALTVARANPVVYGEDLASCLSTFRDRLRDVGQSDAALQLTEEAIEFYRGAAGGRGAVEASAYLGIFLGELGRHEEALSFTRAVVEARQRQADAGGAESQADLAAALSKLSGHLWELRRDKEAYAAARQAAQTWRQAPDPERAAGLRELGSGLSVNLGQHGQALALTAEAVQVYRRLADREPGSYQPELAGALESLSGQQASLGRDGDACATMREALQIYRQLGGQELENRESLDRALYAYAGNLSELGQHGEALAAIEEATEICRPLAATRADRHLSLAGTLLRLGWCLDQAGQREQASLRAEEAMRIYQRYAEADERGFWLHSADSWYDQAWQLRRHGRQGEALPITRSAIALYERLAPADPAADLNYFGALIMQTQQSLTLNLQDEARDACSKAVAQCRKLAHRHLSRWAIDYMVKRGGGELLETLIHLGLEEEVTKTREILADFEDGTQFIELCTAINVKNTGMQTIRLTGADQCGT
jgi:tetratricopeptide (TPR) repeat protein